MIYTAQIVLFYWIVHLNVLKMLTYTITNDYNGHIYIKAVIKMLYFGS